MQLIVPLTALIVVAISICGCSDINDIATKGPGFPPEVLVGFNVDAGNDLAVLSFPRKSELGLRLRDEILKEKLAFGYLVASTDGMLLGAACGSLQKGKSVQAELNTLLIASISNNSTEVSVSRMKLSLDNSIGLASDRVLVAPTGGGKWWRTIAIDKTKSIAWVKPNDDQNNRDDKTDLSFCGSVALSSFKGIATVSLDGARSVDCVIVGAGDQKLDMGAATLLRSPGFAEGMFIASFAKGAQMIVDRSRRQIAFISPSDDPYFVGHEIAVMRKTMLRSPASPSESQWRAYVRQADGNWVEQSLDEYRDEMRAVLPTAPHSALFSFHTHATLLSREPGVKVLSIRRSENAAEAKCTVFETGIPAKCLPVWVAR